jgi:hypothetical protein
VAKLDETELPYLQTIRTTVQQRSSLRFATYSRFAAYSWEDVPSVGRGKKMEADQQFTYERLLGFLIFVCLRLCLSKTAVHGKVSLFSVWIVVSNFII